MLQLAENTQNHHFHKVAYNSGSDNLRTALSYFNHKRFNEDFADDAYGIINQILQQNIDANQNKLQVKVNTLKTIELMYKRSLNGFEKLAINNLVDALYGRQ